MLSDLRQEPCEFPDALVPRVWASLCERLHAPVHTSHRRGVRTVEVLGVLRYHFLTAARRVHFAYAVGKGRFVAGQMHEYVALDPVLSGDIWLAYFAANWLVTRRADVTPEEFPGFATRIGKSSAFRLLLDRVRACRIEGPLRDHVTEAHDLEPDIIRWACQGSPGGELAAIDSRQYSTVWRFREAFEELERESPAFLRPYAAGLLAGVLEEHSEPMRDLKRAFRAFGIKDAGWKLLLEAPPGHFDPVITNSRNDELFEVYLWALHACVSAGRLLPKRVLHRLVMPNGREPGQPRMLDPTFPEGYWAPFLRAVSRRMACIESTEAMRAFLDGEFEDVYDWLEWERPEIDANQARAGWSWMVRQYRTWQETEREKAWANRTEMHWEVPVPTFQHGSWQVVALRDSYELWEEGHLMRHCARTYVGKCCDGREIVFSIRNDDGKRVATGHLVSRGHHWRACSVRGMANRPVGSRIWEVAHAYASACEAVAHKVSNIEKFAA